jgi:hypothetical protein
MQFYRCFDRYLFIKRFTEIRHAFFKRRLWIAAFPLIIIPCHKPIDCSPTFAGVPVAATFLMHQAYGKFESQFPGLSLPSVFDSNSSDYEYYESSTTWGKFTDKIFGPSEATIIIPVYERYSELEEERLGSAGIKKSPVGKLKATGVCQIGCARVLLTEMTLFKLNNDIVWKYP